MILFGSFPPICMEPTETKSSPFVVCMEKKGRCFSICCFWERGFIFPFFYLGEGDSTVFFVLSFHLRVDEDEGGDGSDD